MAQATASRSIPIAGTWRRVSPSVVPVLAVITALIVTIPFMIFTRGEGSVTKGLQVAGSAYAALLEGSVGLAANPVVSVNDVSIALSLAESEGLTRRDLLALAGQAESLIDVGEADIRYYNDVLVRYVDAGLLSDEEADALGERIGDIQIIGEDNLRDFAPLFTALEGLERREVADFARQYAVLEAITDAERAAIVEFVPQADDYEDSRLLEAVRLVDQYGIVRLSRLLEQLDLLQSLEMDPDGDDAEAFGEIYALATSSNIGVVLVRELNAVDQRFIAAGITDVEGLANELRLVGNLYGANVIANDDVTVALTEELPAALEESLVIRRPRNQVLVHEGVTDSPSILYNTLNTPEDTSDDVPEMVYARLGNTVLMFFPGNLETTLTRAIPFIIAGLAVALGFKAGLFNIGAEGQLYAGAILSTYVGYSSAGVIANVIIAILAAGLALYWVSRVSQLPNSTSREYESQVILLVGGMALVIVLALSISSVMQSLLADVTSIPAVVHLFLSLMTGLLGGALWGFIPGALKAFTGAHEVITTIMLNFIAIRLVDWMIKSRDPVILLDTEASTPRTPFIAASAELPTFSSIPTWMFFAAGIVTVLYLLWGNRARLNAANLIRPVIYGVAVIVIGLFLGWVGVRDNLHLGLVVMLFTVWFVEWFLDRTTLGFELKTVGANQEAARYAGMDVKWNIILALTLSGALAGLAGMVEIAGVQHNMQPEFFAGLGFDSIAVALLARNNPRAIIPAGILWGGLLTGAGLMQVRAEISIDLVKIIQAMIIMFIAADAIIRMVWRIPEASDEEKAAATFSKGWGS